jgi:hypothetical protein
MSGIETLQEAISFIKSVNAAIDGFCPNCIDRIREELKSQGAGRSSIPHQHSRRLEPGEPVTARINHYDGQR